MDGYNFFHAPLWINRVDTLSDSLTTLFHASLDSLRTFDELTYDQVDELVTSEYPDNDAAQSLLAALKQGKFLPIGFAGDAAVLPELKQLLNLFMMGLALQEFINKVLRPQLDTYLDDPNRIHVLNSCIARVALDIGLLDRAFEQRLWEPAPAGGHKQSMHGRALALTDAIAVQALLPFREQFWGDRAIVPITFFGRNTHIHHIPYSQNAIVIALNHVHSSVGNEAQAHPPFGMMSIPHEVGHYVYNHGKLRDGTRVSTLSDIVERKDRYRWSEEIFADSYNVFVSGPLGVLGIQAVLAHKQLDALFDDDDEHPTAAIRPFIMTLLMRALAENWPAAEGFGHAALLLDHNWVATLRQRGIHVEWDEHDPRSALIEADRHAVHVADELEKVLPIIATFMNALLDNTPGPSIPWSGNEGHGDVADYAHAIINLTSAQSPLRNNANDLLHSALSAPIRDSLEAYLEAWVDHGDDGKSKWTMGKPGSGGS